MTARDQPSAADRAATVGGHPGPVLVIADNAAIARRALAWAAGFVAAGRVHRVRLVGRATSDVEGLVAEAVGLNATAVLAAGGETARQAGQAVATRLGLPLAIESGPACPDTRRFPPTADFP